MKKTLLTLAAFASIATVTFTSCSKDSTPDPTPVVTPPAASLYDQVGGTALVADPDAAGQMIEKGRLTLRKVTKDAITIIAADNQLKPYFNTLLAELGATPSNTTGYTALVKNFTDFLCTATGAANSSYAYVGKSMKNAHDSSVNTRMSMKTNSADFDKFIGDVAQALNNDGVATGTPLFNALAGALNGLKTDIVQR
jgi:hypothetical protein